MTEVYHITGEGEDAGVVYSEMQGRENTDSDRTMRALLRAMYPPSSGYRSETGGIMENLRESTNNEKVNWLVVRLCMCVCVCKVLSFHLRVLIMRLVNYICTSPFSSLFYTRTTTKTT